MKKVNSNSMPLKVIVLNPPTKEKADEIIKIISQSVSLLYSQSRTQLVEKMEWKDY